MTGGKPKRTLAKKVLAFGVFTGLMVTTCAAVNFLGGGDFVQTTMAKGAEMMQNFHQQGLLGTIAGPHGILGRVKDGAGFLVAHGPGVTSFSLGAISELFAGRK